MAEQETKKPVCDYCQKEVDAVYDLTPAEWSAIGQTYHVCNECYRDAARELEDDGFHLDL